MFEFIYNLLFKMIFIIGCIITSIIIITALLTIIGHIIPTPKEQTPNLKNILDILINNEFYIGQYGTHRTFDILINRKLLNTNDKDKFFDRYKSYTLVNKQEQIKLLKLYRLDYE